MSKLIFCTIKERGHEVYGQIIASTISQRLKYNLITAVGVATVPMHRGLGYVGERWWSRACARAVAVPLAPSSRPHAQRHVSPTVDPRRARRRRRHRRAAACPRPRLQPLGLAPDQPQSLSLNNGLFLPTFSHPQTH